MKSHKKTIMLCLMSLLVLLLIVLFIVSRINQNSGINGKLVAYYTVDEYVAPLAEVVDSRGDTYIIAIMADAVTVNGVQNDELLSKLLDCSLVGYNIRIINGEAGKTILLGNNKVQVYQAYQIEVITNAD